MSQKIGIVGSGLIGRSWAMLFAASEFSVAIYDVIHENVDTALVDIQAQLNNLESKGLLRGKINEIREWMESWTAVEVIICRSMDLGTNCAMNGNHGEDYSVMNDNEAAALLTSLWGSKLSHCEPNGANHKFITDCLPNNITILSEQTAQKIVTSNGSNITAYALIPISGVEVPLEEYILPEVVNITPMNTPSTPSPALLLPNDSQIDKICSNSETTDASKASKSVMDSGGGTESTGSTTDNIIYASIAEANICKCEPHLCERGTCCQDCAVQRLFDKKTDLDLKDVKTDDTFVDNGDDHHLSDEFKDCDNSEDNAIDGSDSSNDNQYFVATEDNEDNGLIDTFDSSCHDLTHKSTEEVVVECEDKSQTKVITDWYELQTMGTPSKSATSSPVITAAKPPKPWNKSKEVN
ncbi:unnamed protein product, partial [Oppiella nova]